MAQYMAGCDGSRLSVTRLGTKNSGARAFARGWHIGGTVSAHRDDTNDCDAITLYLTGGSNGSRPSVCLGTFDERDTPQEIAAKLREAALAIEAQS